MLHNQIRFTWEVCNMMETFSLSFFLVVVVFSGAYLAILVFWNPRHFWYNVCRVCAMSKFRQRWKTICLNVCLCASLICSCNQHISFGMSNLIFPYRVSSSAFSFRDHYVAVFYFIVSRVFCSFLARYSLAMRTNIFAVTRSSKSGAQWIAAHKNDE